MHISQVLENAAVALENVVYILLFLVFMLVGEAEFMHKAGRYTTTLPYQARLKANDEAEEQIYVYIRGKLSLSCLVAGAHGLTLWVIGRDPSGKSRPGPPLPCEVPTSQLQGPRSRSRRRGARRPAVWSAGSTDFY